MERLPWVKYDFPIDAIGSALVALLCTLLVAVAVDLHQLVKTGRYGDPAVAFVIGTIIHTGGVLLLLWGKRSGNNLEYHGPPRNHCTAPVTSFEVSRMKTISDVTMAQSEDLPDDKSQESPTTEESSIYLSMASTSTGESESYDNEDYRSRSLPCFFGCTMPLGCALLLSLMLSSILLLGSLNQQMVDSHRYRNEAMELARGLFVSSYGFFLTATLIYYFQRYSTVMCDNTSAVLRHNPHIAISGCLAMASAAFALSILASAAQDQAKAELGALFGDDGDSQQQAFVGEAWVLSSASLDDDAVSCSDNSGVIAVTVTVAYGGNWGCPQNPDEYCETELLTSVDCDDPDGVLSNTMTASEYVYFRYHDYGVDDDNAYDLTARPSFKYWNRPTESIVGSCDGTCQAQSEEWVSNHFRSHAQSSHAMYICAGVGLCLLGCLLHRKLKPR
jgi:hypothetical protein